MKIPAWWPKALLVAAALLLWWRHDAGQRAEGALRQQIHDVTAQKVAREKVIAAMIVTTAKIDTVRVRDRGAAYDWAARYQRLRDSLFANGDQMIPPHGGTLGGILMVADSAVASCTRALRSCESSIAIRDSLLAHKDTLQWATDSLLTLERKRRPSRFGCVAGGVASSRGVQPGIGCGFRLTK